MGGASLAGPALPGLRSRWNFPLAGAARAPAGHAPFPRARPAWPRPPHAPRAFAAPPSLPAIPHGGEKMAAAMAAGLGRRAPRLCWKVGPGGAG